MDAPPPIDPRRRAVFRGAAILLSLVLGLVVTELALRIWKPRPERRFGTVEEALEYSEKTAPDPDPGGDTSLKGLLRRSDVDDLVFELKPNLDCVYKGEPLRTNSLGYRDDEWTAAKPAGTKRVALVGDSVVFGPFVAEEKTYARLVEDSLTKATFPDGAGRVEALNFGVPGYNSTQEAEVFASRVFRFDPDAVVVGYVGNDDQMPTFIEDIFDSSGDGLLGRSALFEEMAAKSKEEKRRIVRETPDVVMDERVPEKYRRMVGWPAVERALRRMGAVAKEKSVPVLVTIYESEAGPSYEPHPRAKRHEQIARVAGEVGFDVLDMSAVLGAVARERGWKDIVPLWVGPRNGHLNAEGHALFADALVKRLVESGCLARR